MNYLDAWQRGFKEGKEFSLQQLNEHCKTNFANWTEVILYLNKVEKINKQEVANAKS
jgi:hypothetical protein